MISRDFDRWSHHSHIFVNRLYSSDRLRLQWRGRDRVVQIQWQWVMTMYVRDCLVDWDSDKCREKLKCTMIGMMSWVMVLIIRL